MPFQSDLFQGQAIQCGLREPGIAELRFDLQGESVNKFNQATIRELDQAVTALAQAEGVQGLLITSGKSVFIVGADINEFLPAFQRSEPEIADWLQQAQAVFNRLEDLPFPSVAAVNGYCLGGGMELAMAATYRVLSEKATVGQPEIKLGLIPGFGGTVRLPRLIGVDNALDLIASGRDVKPAEALKLRICSAVVPPERLEDAALAKLRSAMAGDGWRAMVAQKTSPVLLNRIERTMAFTVAKGFVAQQANPKHYPAPMESVNVMERAAGDSRDAALRKEAEGFARMAKTPQAAALIGVFHADQFLKKKAKEQSSGAREVKLAGVLGAGIMGGGIAYQAASRGVPVVMKDIDPAAIEKGMGEAARLFGGQAQRGRITTEEAAIGLTRIQGVLSYGEFAHTDVVVEAVTENPKVKRQVLAEAEAAAKPETVLATNTSTIPLSQLADALKRPELFCGMHFFNPVHRMPLVEVIRHEGTSPEAVATVVAYAQRLGKTPVVVKDGPGFLVNRILGPYMMAFQLLVMEGVDFHAIDKAMTGFGWPMGPAELSDVVGLDTAYHAGQVMAKGLPGFDVLPDNAPTALLYEAGRYGQKNGMGYFRWEPDRRGRPQKQDDPAVADVLKPAIKGGAQEMAPEAIVERMMLPMVIEGSRCLEQGVVETPFELDMAMLMGLGFPPFRGGLLRDADATGVARLVEAAGAHEGHGALYAPTEQMKKLAAAGEGFYPPVA